MSLTVPRRIEHNREQKGDMVGYILHSLRGQLPLTSEVALGTRLSTRRNYWHEQGAGTDLFADFLIPLVTTDELKLIEPNLNTGGPHRLAQAPRACRVFGCIANKDRAAEWVHGSGGLA